MNKDLIKSKILDCEAEIYIGGVSLISFEPFSFVAKGIKQTALDVGSSATKEAQVLFGQK